MTLEDFLKINDAFFSHLSLKLQWPFQADIPQACMHAHTHAHKFVLAPTATCWQLTLSPDLQGPLKPNPSDSLQVYSATKVHCSHSMKYIHTHIWCLPSSFIYMFIFTAVIHTINSDVIPILNWAAWNLERLNLPKWPLQNLIWPQINCFLNEHKALLTHYKTEKGTEGQLSPGAQDRQEEMDQGAPSSSATCNKHPIRRLPSRVAVQGTGWRRPLWPSVLWEQECCHHSPPWPETEA